MNDIDAPIPFGSEAQASEWPIGILPQGMVTGDSPSARNLRNAVARGVFTVSTRELKPTQQTTQELKPEQQQSPWRTNGAVANLQRPKGWKLDNNAQKYKKGKREEQDKQKALAKKKTGKEGENLDAFKRDLESKNEERRTISNDKTQSHGKSIDLRSAEKAQRKLADKKAKGTYKPKQPKLTDRELGEQFRDIDSKAKGDMDAKNEQIADLKEQLSDADSKPANPETLEDKINESIAKRLEEQELAKVDQIESETLINRHNSLTQVSTSEWFTIPNGEHLDGLRLIVVFVASLLYIFLLPTILYLWIWYFSLKFLFFSNLLFLYPAIMYKILKSSFLYTEVNLKIQRTEINKHQDALNKKTLFDQDLRPDLVSHADIKHYHPLMTSYRISWKPRGKIADMFHNFALRLPNSEFFGTGVWCRPLFLNHYSENFKIGSEHVNFFNQSTNLVVSAEGLSQLMIARTMHYSVNEEVFRDRVRQISAGFSKINYDRYSELYQQNMLANTEFIAYLYFLSHKIRYSPLKSLINPMVGGPQNLITKINW
jgi:hypothetical protein